MVRVLNLWILEWVRFITSLTRCVCGLWCLQCPTLVLVPDAVGQDGEEGGLFDLLPEAEVRVSPVGQTQVDRELTRHPRQRGGKVLLHIWNTKHSQLLTKQDRSPLDWRMLMLVCALWVRLMFLSCRGWTLMTLLSLFIAVCNSRERCMSEFRALEASLTVKTEVWGLSLLGLSQKLQHRRSFFLLKAPNEQTGSGVLRVDLRSLLCPGGSSCLFLWETDQ